MTVKILEDRVEHRLRRLAEKPTSGLDLTFEFQPFCVEFRIVGTLLLIVSLVVERLLLGLVKSLSLPILEHGEDSGGWATVDISALFNYGKDRTSLTFP